MSSNPEESNVNCITQTCTRSCFNIFIPIAEQPIAAERNRVVEVDTLVAGPVERFANKLNVASYAISGPVGWLVLDVA